KWIAYENTERVAGETKWSFWKLLLYAFEGIMAFSTAPLVLSSIVGIILSLASFASICFIVIRHLLYGNAVTGWASTVTIILFVAGIQLFFVGVIGSYLAKTYLEVKHRPIYICSESNIEEKK
ncbi:MAG: glycosyltransferase, partial [Clostridia bacterium]|nr:glycosyltransferase [Clostridia bacterium]